MKKPLTFLLSLLVVATAGAEKPNILLILADDMAPELVRAFGENSEVETPNLDKLAARGTRFSHAYNMGGWNGAVCVASRTMLNTGLTMWHAQKAEPKLKKGFIEEGRMWAQQLSAAGYRTYMTGKWHVKADATEIFDLAEDIRPGMPNQFEKKVPEAYLRPNDSGWTPTDKKWGGFWEGGTHWSEVVANNVEAYLAKDAESEKPFFMYVAFNAPHDPRQAPQEYQDRYKSEDIGIPENFLPEYPFMKEMGAGRKLRDERLAPWPRTPEAVQLHRHEYYALITHMDTQIGRIFAALEKTGEADNTWVIFTADHGLACGQHGLLGKQSLFDHSVRSPFIIAGPGVAAGETIDAPIYYQDLMPTTLEIAEAEIPDTVEFRSLMPFLKDGTPEVRDHIIHTYTSTQRGITKDGMKLILYPKAPKALLFDLKNDPHETTDVLAERTQDGKALFALLKSELQQLGDPLELRFPELR